MLTTISRNALLLAVFAIICTGAIAIISQLSQPIIAQQEQKALLKTLNQLIPKASYNNDIFASCFIVNDDNLLGKGQSQQVFVAKKDNQPVALMLQASTFQGYAGEIKLAIGIHENGQLAGVRVIRHSETPGLGDNIQTNKSDWIFSFSDKSYQKSQDKRWDVRKNGGDFDAFTGATITPRAVVLAVKNALIYFAEHKETLFKHRANCGEAQ
ncbi:electron transport complex subunit RsxG [Psychromonas antarctica]|jgi:electron transport complex protein RnfG|uniref:electron transport complex subunit RsxG n=1 Tax=Psychromonas antarctica TaxID=67573 RepID=UPI001EE83BCC|nr:electron transport complex subunit RsxG [Psychromonas antarctica]MCG6199900.1 electron transport complex subunit RsxG [Psychromonas antarctica]